MSIKVSKKSEQFYEKLSEYAAALNQWVPPTDIANVNAYPGLSK